MMTYYIVRMERIWVAISSKVERLDDAVYSTK